MGGGCGRGQVTPGTRELHHPAGRLEESEERQEDPHGVLQGVCSVALMRSRTSEFPLMWSESLGLGGGGESTFLLQWS